MSKDEPREQITVLGDDGIHTLIHRLPLNDDGSKREWVGPTENVFWGRVESLMQESDQVLRDEGFPSATAAILYAVGHGWIPQGVPPRNDNEADIVSLVEGRDRDEAKEIYVRFGNPPWGVLAAYEYAAKHSEPFSEAWYAGQIFGRCALIGANKDNTFEGHLMRIYELAEFEKDRAWRRDFGLMIKRDIKGQKARKAGGHARKVAVAPQTAEVLWAMKKMKDEGITVSRAADLVFRKGVGSSQGANQKLWTRYKDKF